ncbi:MAG TPA: DNA methylase [Firmicutes bacterium]|nr:DNA methylase [Bacillota bacterium]
MNYAILYNPGHNRVYFETSLKLSISEFHIVAQKFSTEFENLQHQNIDGLDYLTFETSQALSSSDVKMIFDLSFIYALFQIEYWNGELYLKPIRKIREDFVDESIGSILKYTGKTNEIFTRMMINVAFYSQSNHENIRLLDPIAGKGTTLYEGLRKGYHVYGIEIGDSLVNESYHFVKRFLETAKYKFDYASIKISGSNKSFSACRHTFETARTKEDFKNKNTRVIEFIAGNARYADQYYRKNYFDIIVGDLPYGVQHGNVTNEKQSSLTRNPAELLHACLPAWKKVLKPNGIIVLAWNCHVLPRKKMEELFEEQGFTVKNDAPYLQFEHRVDQSILRDMIVAQKNL